ncbi:C4-dicarboxylate transport protein [compost metagenome]
MAGLALILGIDRFMSEARALTNLIGNGVASVVVAKWVGQLDADQLQRELANPSRTAVELPLVAEPVVTADAARR